MRATRVGSHARGLRAAFASGLVWLAACSEPPASGPPPVPAAWPESSPTAPPPAAEVLRLGDAVPEPRRVIVPARLTDERDRSARIRVRRLVYRFELRIPWSLGPGQSEIPIPTGELTIDIAGPRLRARFTGGAFPVDEGAQVRMRIDELGSYVVDAREARPVTTGQLAAWFQGGPSSRSTDLVVRTAVPDDPQFIDFVCRLFGEWAGTTMASVRRACAADGLPTRFTFGAYKVERTAEVVLDVAERTMRADHLDLPRLRHVPVLAFHDDSVRARLRPTVEEPPRRPPAAGLPSVERGVVVENRAGGRVLVVVSGVPLGWMDEGQRFVAESVPPGGYVVGGLLGLGDVAGRTRAYALPAYVPLER